MCQKLCYIAVALCAYDFKSVCNDSDSHELLAVVSAVHHERVGEAFNDWALCLAESLDGIATC